MGNSFKKNSNGRADEADRPRRTAKPATPERLEKAAYHYLERFSTSADNLRRVLMRRVQNSAYLHDTDPQVGAEAIDKLIVRFLEAGLLDDAAYARTRAVSLHRQGKGTRAIRQTLSIKGVEADVIDGALDGLAEELGPSDPDAALIGRAETDFAAAINYARRRRLGPYRRKEREESREKDLAALGRQGFGYDTARRVIEAEDIESLEQECDELLNPAPLP
jgi:regulatory protein